MCRIVTEPEFREALYALLARFQHVRSVSGPGRSGAIASVYASHRMGVPWLPSGMIVPEHLRPHLVIDTAVMTGATLRRAAREAGGAETVAVFTEPPRLKFWYEREAQ